MRRLRGEVRAVAAVDDERGQAEVPDVRVAEDGAGAERVRGGGGGIGQVIVGAVIRAILRTVRRRARVVLDVEPSSYRKANYRKNW
jgi:hypothetical protein